MPLDLTKYAIGLDVWEGSGDINEGIIKAAGIEFLIIRMNTSWGGLQYDKNFLTQWAQASGFARAAYVVIDPGIAADAYRAWIKSSKPSDCNIICPDIEIKGSTPAAYSALLTKLYAGLIADGNKVVQYSGYGSYFLANPWVKSVDQWWARYLYSVHPTELINGVLTATHPNITWEELKVKLAALNWTPLVTSLSEAQTGHIAIWQATSSYILPGCANHPVDVNLMPRADFTRIFGATIPPVVIPPVIPPVVLLTRDQVLDQLVSDWRKANPGK